MISREHTLIGFPDARSCDSLNCLWIGEKCGNFIVAILSSDLRKVLSSLDKLFGDDETGRLSNPNFFQDSHHMPVNHFHLLQNDV